MKDERIHMSGVHTDPVATFHIFLSSNQHAKTEKN